MEYVVFPNNSLLRRFIHFASLRRFNLFEVTSIALITVTIYSVILICVGTNSSLFCSFGHESSSISYINFQDYLMGNFENKLNVRINESTRILMSVRKELSQVSKKMKEIHRVTDDLNREIPIKEQKLVILDEEIAAVQRRFNELKDSKNVRVFLPHSPIFNKESLPSIPNTLGIDLSRCSITSFMPIYLEELADSDQSSLLLHESLRKIGNNLVDSKERACLTIRVGSGRIDAATNLVIISTKEINSSGNSIVFHPGFSQSYYGSSLYLEVGKKEKDLWKNLPSLFPLKRKNLLFLFLEEETQFDQKTLDYDILRLQESGQNSSDSIRVIRCSQKGARSECLEKRVSSMKNSIFCVLVRSPNFQKNFWESLKTGCIPVVLSLEQQLPFQETIDWSLASIRISPYRLPELHFILRGFDSPEIVEMKRMGRLFFEKYLGDVDAVSATILSFLNRRLGLILPPAKLEKAESLFEDSFQAKILTPVNKVVSEDDEFLGPLEAPIISESFKHNFSISGMYARTMWNGFGDVSRSPEYLREEVELPAEAEFHEDTKPGFRPISPGSGSEFKKALGGNREGEQFTIVILTFNRDAVLFHLLERLHKLPYLKKILIIWNNVGREPKGPWPRLHVPVEFIKVTNNSLNNRFVPWDRIDTEAILSMDDDIDLRQDELVLAFRVWRENRDRLVGFPARFHARFGEDIFYNSNHTCQYSMILTGGAFLHKSFLHEYANQMPEVIREHVDTMMNCEDIAMNFLVSHITRKPPIKVTSKWTFRCPTCTEALTQGKDHFQKRSECIRYFTKIYGYNPLKYTQFRSDSVLFKTRLPSDSEKCFKYV